MTSKTLAALFVSLISLAGAASTAHADLDIRKSGGTVILTSGAPGETENIRLTESQGAYDDYLIIEYSTGFDSLQLVGAYSLSSVTQIILWGDDDREWFRNDTAIPSTVYAGGGNDELIGGSRRDIFYGEEGMDYLRGNNGNDILDPGDDPIEGEVIGGRGRDEAHIAEFRVLYGYGYITFDQQFEYGNDVAEVNTFTTPIWTTFAEYFSQM